jgi:hypothetical protein
MKKVSTMSTPLLNLQEAESYLAIPATHLEEVEVNLRLTVSWPVCLWCRAPP